MIERELKKKAFSSGTVLLFEMGGDHINVYDVYDDSLSCPLIFGIYFLYVCKSQ